MSTRNFIGSDQNSSHPLLDDCGWRVQRLCEVVVYLTRVNSVYCVMGLYANGIYARDERHPTLVS